MNEIIIALLDRIENELTRCYWNKHQKELNSPFANTGETYSNEVFSVKAYNWAEEENDEPNFNSDLLKCTWYKHSHRCLDYNLNFKEGESELKQLGSFLDSCLEAIRKDFG